MKKSLTNEKLVELLLVHGSVKATAAALGMSARAIYARLADPNVRQMYAEARGRLLESATGNLCESLNSAIDFLHSVVDDKEAPLALKIQCADSLLRHAVRYVEVADVTNRLSALEQKLDEVDGGNA